MRLCPNCVLSLALNGSITTKPNEYAVSVHPAQLTEVCKSICKACNAVVTMVESTVIISSDSATIGNTINGLTASYLFLNSLCIVLFCSILHFFINRPKDMDDVSNLWCCYDFCTVFHFNKERWWLLKAIHNLLIFVLASQRWLFRISMIKNTLFASKNKTIYIYNIKI